MKNKLITLVLFGMVAVSAQQNKNFELYENQRSIELKVENQANVMISDKCTMYLKMSELLTILELKDLTNKEKYNYQSHAWLRLWLKDKCTNASYERYSREVKEVGNSK